MNNLTANTAGSCKMQINQYDSLSAAIASIAGAEVRVLKSESVSGGDINRAYAMSLSNGEKIFMKANTIENVRFFSCEAHGLFTLSKCAAQTADSYNVPCVSAVSVAKPLAYGVECGKNDADENCASFITFGMPAGEFSFLLLEYIDSSSGGHGSGRSARDANFWRNFGHSLAALHLADADEFVKQKCSDKTERNADCAVDCCGTGRRGADGEMHFGFFENNYIGATHQINTPRATWLDFFRECRLLPQIKMAERYFDASFLRKCSNFLERLDNYISEPKVPSILHGDLWGGNVMCGTDGKAWLIDPAVYVGHFEADLAMTQLFGSFPRAFYDAYNEINPLCSGYDTRREIYNLYQLLNHLNLFGAGYLSEVQYIINKF